MNQEEFIDAIKIAVAASAQQSIKSILDKPPGRQPASQDIELSKWFNNLDELDKEMALKVVQKTAHMTVFGFLCVLDGVRAIESGKDKGRLNLYYNKGENVVLLNDPREEFLHDLW